MDIRRFATAEAALAALDKTQPPTPPTGVIGKVAPELDGDSFVVRMVLDCKQTMVDLGSLTQYANTLSQGWLLEETRLRHLAGTTTLFLLLGE